jgi:phospholipase D-like protein
MVIAADYPFLDVFFTMILFFFWVAWIWTLISVLGDVFRRHDISGWHKAAWMFFLILIPFLGVLIYLIAHGKDMAKRDAERIQAVQAQYAQMAGASNSAAEIEKANALLQSGTITQAEFDSIKAKALA